MEGYNGQLILVADSLSNKKEYYRHEIDVYNFLLKEIETKNVVYTSLLPGPETTLAQCAFDTNIPFIATIPYKDWSKKWTRKEKNTYKQLLKKAAKVVYVDREEGYVSDFYPPDHYSLQKIGQQIKWLVEKVKIYPGITKVITYVSGLSSYKKRTLQFELSTNQLAGKWHLKQKTNMHIILPEDDLPF